MEVSEMVDRRTYLLEVTREPGWWIVAVPELDFRTQAATLAEVEEMGRELVAVVLDVEPDSFDVNVRVEPPRGVAAQLAAADAADAAAREGAAQAARDRREAVAQLHDEYSVSVGDIAGLLGVGRSRVYALLSDRGARKHRRASA